MSDITFAWQPMVERLRRRKNAEGRVMAVGAFLSAAKEAFPLMGQLPGLALPAAVNPENYQRITDSALALVTIESIPSAIRRGLAKKFITEILLECTREPVTDEEVEAGRKRAEVEHEASLKERRAAKAESERERERAAARAGAKDNRAAAAPVRAAPEDEDEDEEERVDQERGDPSEAETDEEDLPHSEDADTTELTPPQRPTALAARAHRGARNPQRTTTQHEDEMNEQNDDEVLEENEDEQLDEVDERPPSRRAKAPRAPAQTVYVAMPQPPQRTKPRAEAQRAPRSAFFANSQDLVRIYKRGQGGKRIPIGDYTKEDIGPGMSLHMFVKEYIDPENSDPSGRTTYECVQVNARGDEVGRAVAIYVESQPQDQQAQGPIGQVREVMDLFHELRAADEEKNEKNNELLNQMKSKAVGNGDMNSMMMMFMMERLMAPKRDDDVVIRVLEKLGIGNPQHAPAPAAAAAPPAMPPMQFPMQMLPPAPAPSTALDKLLEASIANMLKPAPSIFEQLKEMQAMQQILHPQPAPGAMDANAVLLKTLLERQNKPAEVGGIEGAMMTFEKLHTMVKTLAPQVNMGGWAAPIQGILSNPEVQKAVANVLGGVMPGAPGGPPNGARPQQATPPQQLQAGVQQPQQPQQQSAPKPTPEMLEAAKKLAIAQTLEFRIIALQELLTAMYMGPWQGAMEPMLKSMMDTGNVQPAQQFIATVLMDVNPQLATIELVNGVLASMANSAGPAGVKVLAALEASKPASQPVPAPGTIETPNAKVIPIRETQADPNRAAYDAQVAALREGNAAAPAPAPTPHQPEVEVKAQPVVPAPAPVVPAGPNGVTAEQLPPPAQVSSPPAAS